MAESHYFDIQIAKLYGVHCAVILQNIWHWVRKNEANGNNFHDGMYWTYNSTKAFSELFPYLTQKQVRTALLKLVEEGILVTGNYNEMKYDRTTWYAVTQKGKSILLLGQMDVTEKPNGNDTGVKPIPDINAVTNPVSKPNRNKAFIPPTFEEVQAYCNERQNTVDAKFFHDYFSSSGWVDSNGKAVRNWKQKIITWEGFASKQGRNDTHAGVESNIHSARKYGNYI